MRSTAGPPARRRSLRERLRGADSYGLLLLLILLLLLLTAAFGDQGWGRVLVAASSGAMTLFAFWTSRPGARTLRRATAGVALVVVGTAAATAGAGRVVDAASRALIDLLTIACPVVVGRRLLTHPRVQGSTILGALCIYLLLGLSFAYLFSAIGALAGPFFAGRPGASIVDCLYFRFATLTTVGYGDLVAAGDVGHMLAVSEALVGQLYLVTVVALLVGNVGRGRARPPDQA